MFADELRKTGPRQGRRLLTNLSAAARRGALLLAIPCIAGSLLSSSVAGSNRPGGAAAFARPGQQAFGQLPLYFVENRGQVDARVAYYVQGRDTSVYFTAGGVTLAQTGQDHQRWTVKLDFVGAGPVAPAGEVRTPATVSYFTGGRQDWKTGLDTYASIAYRNLWPGIDLIYSGTVNRLKYEYVLQPGADVAQIRMRYRGASELRINEDGGLDVRTPAGGFADDAPYVYQEIDGRRVEIESAYVLHGAGEYGFRVGDYDRTRPLILDPAVLVYCGFIGGLGDESMSAGEPVRSAIAVDAAGNVYVTGGTQSTEGDFPTSVGPDLTANGNVDVFVAKVNASGTGLVYAGFFGGSGYEWGYDIAVDGSGSAYITGMANSNDAETYPDFPLLVGPDLTFNGFGDAFIAKVNATGTALVYSGFIGGLGNDEGNGIAVDAAGNAYIVGNTSSHEVYAGFPVLGGPDLTFNGSTDTFVAKVNASGSALVYNGYVGGEGTDTGRGIAIDGAGNAYVTGGSNSTAGIANWFAFVTKVDSAGAFVYHFHIQGAGSDEANAIAVDADGNAYITGYTRSDQASFPVTGGPDLTFNGPAYDGDAFVAKINAAGNALVYAGYIGGGTYDEGHAIAVDADGNAYIAGRTHSTEATFPVADGPDLTFNNPAAPTSGADGFVAKVNASGTGLVYAGYIGGSFDDQATGIAVDATGSAYIVGVTSSTEADFPVTVGPDLTFNGYYDLFVAKISGGTPGGGGSGDITFVNTTLTTIDCPAAVTSLPGSLSIVGNATATRVNCGELVSAGAGVTISGNHAVEVIDLGNLTNVAGSLAILDNGNAGVDLSLLESVGGDLAVESQGTGTFDVDACVNGTSQIDLAGYATLLAAAALGGTTVTMEDGSIVTLELEPGTFPDCVSFSIVRTLTINPATGFDQHGEPVVIDLETAYEFVFAVPVLGVPATLTFDIVMSTLDEARQAEVLEALDAGMLTLVTRSDDVGSSFQSFPVCAAGQEPAVEGCVQVQALDAAGNPTTATPAIVRFTGIVGHFSTWGVGIVTPRPASSSVFNGLLPPYPAPPQATTPTFRRGSVVPLKFNWTNGEGLVIDSATASPSVTIYPGTCSAEPTTTPIAADDAGQSDGFRYDAATNTWVFSWNTKPLAEGCYWIQINSGTVAYPAPGATFPIALR